LRRRGGTTKGRALALVPTGGTALQSRVAVARGSSGPAAFRILSLDSAQGSLSVCHWAHIS
jgi:hypothetical protein